MSQITYWNYCNAWIKHMQSTSIYHPLYSSSIWEYNTQDRWNEAVLSTVPNIKPDTKEVNNELNRLDHLLALLKSIKVD